MSDYVDAYVARTGLDPRPALPVYLAYNFFRIAAILQGIIGRVRDGTATSEFAPAKAEMIRAQSLSFLLGAIVLFFAYLHTGVLNATTLPVSAWMVLPTMAAMVVGYRIHDRLDQDRFRKATLAVLVITGLNLLRRALL